MADFDPYIIARYQELGNQTSNADMQTLADVALKRTQNQGAQYQLRRQQNLANIVSQNAGAFSNPYAQALAQGGYGQEAYEAQVNALAMGQKILGIHRDITASRLAAAQTPEQLDAVISSVPQDIHQLYGIPAKDATPAEKENWRKSFLTGQLTPQEQAQLEQSRYEGKDIAGVPLVFDKRVGAFRGDDDIAAIGLLSGPAIDAVAQQLHQTGKMPSLGTDPGGRNERAIRARHAELYPNDNLAANTATNEANAESLKNLQPQADTINSFIRTFDKNLGTLEAIASKLQSSNAPALNKGLRWYQTNVSGDPTLSAFRQALSTVTSEAGKINSGSTGSGGVPISMLQEMEHNLPVDATPKQIVEALNVLRKDSENRRDAIQEQLGVIKGRLGGKATKETVKSSKNATAHPQASEALTWARQHSNNPKSTEKQRAQAAEILKRLGVK